MSIILFMDKNDSFIFWEYFAAYFATALVIWLQPAEYESVILFFWNNFKDTSALFFSSSFLWLPIVHKQ